MIMTANIAPKLTLVVATKYGDNGIIPPILNIINDHNALINALSISSGSIPNAILQSNSNTSSGSEVENHPLFYQLLG